MSMSRKLFRPKPGQVPARYSAFRYSGTIGYRGDVAYIDTTAPTSQGASGVVDGATMGTSDFIYVNSAVSKATNATIGLYQVAGVIEGRSVGDRNTTTALDDDGVVIVQVAGVHTQTWMSASDGVAGWLALGNSANTLGQALAQLSISTVVTTTAPQIDAGFLVGSILSAAATAQTRGTVTTAYSNVVWVRCGDVV